MEWMDMEERESLRMMKNIKRSFDCGEGVGSVRSLGIPFGAFRWNTKWSEDIIVACEF
jgi:hypothetical protein